MARVGLSRERVPTLFAPGDVGALSVAASEQLGLPVVGGAGDGQSAGLGANATRPGSAYDELFAICREIYPRTAPLHRALQQAFDG